MNQSNSNIKFAFFGSSQFSEYVLEELKLAGFEPIYEVRTAKGKLPMDELRRVGADLFVVASFGKILPAELIYMPPHKTLNVHPSLLPKLRGPAPIQGAILSGEKTGVSIMLMDEEMDHGPILAAEEVDISPWPDHYARVEEKLGRAGGKLLARIMPTWIRGEVEAHEQDHSSATYTKIIKKEDGLINLNGSPEENLRKVYAYSTWPGAYFFHTRKDGKKLRVVVKDARVEDGKFSPTRVVPEGKKEMDWQDFLRGNQ